MDRKHYDEIVIIAGGEIKKHIAPGDKTGDCLVIAVNGGIKNCMKLGITPHLVIGDLDSAGQNEIEYLELNRIKTIKFSREKDKSDLEIALDYGVEYNPRIISIFGAWGGRMDHFLFNILLLFKFGDRGIRIGLMGEREVMFAAEPGMMPELPPGTEVSFVPFSPVVEEVTLQGFKYPLRREDITMGSTRSLSNVVESTKAKIDFKNGKMLAVVNIRKQEKFLWR